MKSVSVLALVVFLAGAAVAAAGGGLALFYYQVSAYDRPETLPGLFIALHPAQDGYHASAYGVSEYRGQPLILHLRSRSRDPSETLLDAVLTLDICPGCEYHARSLHSRVPLSDVYVRLADYPVLIPGRVVGVWAEVGGAAFSCQRSFSELSDVAFYWRCRASADAAVRR